jgi:diguanylate cyclase
MPYRYAGLPTLRQVLAQVHLRLILFAVTLAAASLLVSGTVVIRNYAQKNLDLLARTVSYTVEPAIVFGDAEAVREGMISVAGVSTVDRIEVRDAGGKTLAVWSKAEDGGVDSWLERYTNRLLWDRPSVRPVKHAGETIGEVRVSGNSEGILRYALSGMIIALACLGLTVLATRILAQRLQKEVIEPLSQLAQISNSVRTERAFHRRLPSSGIAEIDTFGRDFNALLAELEGWHHGLTSENAELTRRAHHDPLTGLGNRALFEQTLAEAVPAALQTGSSLGVCYLDIDAFKAINDTHGHAAGDAALTAVAERLRAAIRQGDRAYRLGGDEFAVLLPALTSAAHVAGVRERIEREMARPFVLPGGTEASARLSIGVAIFPDDGLAPQDLLKHADAQMYADKLRHRNPENEEVDHA